MSKQCIAMTLFLCESSVFSSRIRRRKREESGWVNNYTWRRVLQSALYNKLATICVSLLWRTFENKNSTAIYQPYTINVFLNWLHHVCYDTVGFLHFTTSFCSSILCMKRWKVSCYKSHTHWNGDDCAVILYPLTLRRTTFEINHFQISCQMGCIRTLFLRWLANSIFAKYYNLHNPF